MASNGQDPYTHWPQPPRDGPSRNAQVSPPTGYISSLPRDGAVSPPSPPTHRSFPTTLPPTHPATHPSSQFNQLQGSRNRSLDDPATVAYPPYPNQNGYSTSMVPRSYPETGAYAFPLHSGRPQDTDPTADATTGPGRDLPPTPPELPLPTDSSDARTPVAAPIPSGHRGIPFNQADDDRNRARELGYSTSMRTNSTITPGMDNLGATAAGGGIAGIALGVANTNERESGIEALRAIERNGAVPSNPGYGPPERGFDMVGSDTPYVPQRPEAAHALQQRSSYSSTVPLGFAAASPGQLTPRPPPSDESIPLGMYPSPDRLSNGPSYSDNPYNQFSTAWDPRINPGLFHPNEIADDGEDEFVPQESMRKSVLSFGKDLDRGASAGGATGAAATGGMLGGIGGLLGRKNTTGAGVRGNSSGQYGPVPGQGFDDGVEKSEWLSRQTTGRKKLRWTVGVIVVVLVVAAVVGAIVGGVIGSRNSRKNSPSQGQSATADDGKGDLTKDSSEIQKLLGNSKLHKVFPGMDYTPFNVQYPDCLSNPPSQNNVTRDMAVLSQLTNAVRLYGTDCNQTEMVLHSIDKLGLTDMKVWLGVWLSNNATTNNRQMDAMYNILDQHGDTPFAGVIVGNEVLFRKDMTTRELGDVLSGVKSNFTSKKIKLPVATSDLGDDWTAGLVAEVDIVMSNVHPFFAGVEVGVAAGWTWDFWQTHDVVLTQGTTKKNVISEVGWPSAGGNDCGGSPCTSKTAGSIAGIDEMNSFMKSFVCGSLSNGTDYFWYVLGPIYIPSCTVANLRYVVGSKPLTNRGKSD